MQLGVFLMSKKFLFLATEVPGPVGSEFKNFRLNRFANFLFSS